MDKKIENYLEKSAIANEVADKLSNLLKETKSKNGERKHKIINSEGKEIELAEKHMWDELLFGGCKTPGAKKLLELYPEIFEENEKMGKVKKEMSKLEFETFGFTHEQMSISNLIKLILLVK